MSTTLVSSSSPPLLQLETSRVIPVRAYNNGVDAITTTSNTTSTSLSSSSSSSSLSLPPEYVMIELNGELIAPVQYPSPDTCRTVLGKDDAIELGKLCVMDAKTKKPTMTIGSHIMTGTIQQLKEPFCLMQKQYTVDAESGHRVLEAYQIIGMVRQKYLFNSYPKVITQ